MHKHWFTFDISEISCKILICINYLFLYICLLVLELNGSHQHSPWSICDSSVVDDLLFIVASIVGVCNCTMFCCTLLCIPSSFAIILVGRRGLVSLLGLSSWYLVVVV